jgi:arginase family enzyme
LNHCCPVTRAVDAGFDPAKIALIGISGWMNPKTELDYCRESGITIIWLEEIWERGTAAVIEQAVEIAGAGDGIYLSFDVDALDAAYAPGTCCPSPGGLTSREAIEIVRGVSRRGLLGVDVVEAAPGLDCDTTSSTALISARVALEAMAAHAGMGR